MKPVRFLRERESLYSLFLDLDNIIKLLFTSFVLFFIFQAYDHILQETTTELTELEVSITNKTELVQKLQDEILDMTVSRSSSFCTSLGQNRFVMLVRSIWKTVSRFFFF